MQQRKLNRPEAIFFDLDETLVDNTRPVESLFRDLFREYVPAAVSGGKISAPVADVLRAQVTALWENMFEEGDDAEVFSRLFHQTLQQCSLDTSLAQAMSAELLRAAGESVRLREGATQILGLLRAQGIRVGIITNGLVVLQREKIGQLGLERHVDEIVVSQSTGAHKPDARVFEYALGKIGASAGKAWHVGDHPHNDVSGAIASGMHGILYLPADAKPARFGASDSAPSPPDATIVDLMEVADLLAAARKG